MVEVLTYKSIKLRSYCKAKPILHCNKGVAEIFHSLKYLVPFGNADGPSFMIYMYNYIIIYHF